jgi:hypothetical protein
MNINTTSAGDKPWGIVHNGVVYHFYCAVGKEGRVIALATSKDLRADRSSGNNSVHNKPDAGDAQ